MHSCLHEWTMTESLIDVGGRLNRECVCRSCGMVKMVPVFGWEIKPREPEPPKIRKDVKQNAPPSRARNALERMKAKRGEDE